MAAFLFLYPFCTERCALYNVIERVASVNARFHLARFQLARFQLARFQERLAEGGIVQTHPGELMIALSLKRH